MNEVLIPPHDELVKRTCTVGIKMWVKEVQVFLDNIVDAAEELERIQEEQLNNA